MFEPLRCTRGVCLLDGEREAIVGKAYVVGLKRIGVLLRVEAHRKVRKRARILGVIAVLDLAFDIEPVAVASRAHRCRCQNPGDARN